MLDGFKDKLGKKIAEVKMPDLTIPRVSLPNWQLPSIALSDEAKKSIEGTVSQMSGSIVALIDHVVAGPDTQKAVATVIYQALPLPVRLVLPEDKFLHFMASNWTSIYNTAKVAATPGAMVANHAASPTTTALAPIAGPASVLSGPADQAE